MTVLYKILLICAAIVIIGLAVLCWAYRKCGKEETDEHENNAV